MSNASEPSADALLDSLSDVCVDCGAVGDCGCHADACDLCGNELQKGCSCERCIACDQVEEDCGALTVVRDPLGYEPDRLLCAGCEPEWRRARAEERADVEGYEADMRGAA